MRPRLRLVVLYVARAWSENALLVAIAVITVIMHSTRTTAVHIYRITGLTPSSDRCREFIAQRIRHTVAGHMSKRRSIQSFPRPEGHDSIGGAVCFGFVVGLWFDRINLGESKRKKK